MAPVLGGDAAMPDGDTSVGGDYAVWLKMNLPGMPSYLYDGRWQSSAGKYRFVIEGDAASPAAPTPEPATACLMPSAALVIARYRRIVH